MSEQQHEQEHGGATSSFALYSVAIVILLLLAGYGALVSQNLPQKWTELAIAESSHEEHAADHDGEEHADHEHAEAEHADADAAPEMEAAKYPPIWMVAPFAILLLCIAVLPLIPATEHWWESNLQIGRSTRLNSSHT